MSIVCTVHLEADPHLCKFRPALNIPLLWLSSPCTKCYRSSDMRYIAVKVVAWLLPNDGASRALFGARFCPGHPTFNRTPESLVLASHMLLLSFRRTQACVKLRAHYSTQLSATPPPKKPFDILFFGRDEFSCLVLAQLFAARGTFCSSISPLYMY